MVYEEQWERYVTRINARLEEYLADPDIPGNLLAAMRYSVFAGGKRLRPVLALAAAELLNADLKQTLPLACALELLHTYSLIHDDLPAMDNDDLRRGIPTNHKMYGEAMAVLAGDALQSLAFLVLLSGDMALPGYVKAMREITRRSGAHGMVAGQSADMKLERRDWPEESLLQYIHAHKTADLIEAAVLCGAYMSAATEAEFQAVAAYGRNLGLGFQVCDDLLDVQGQDRFMGKTPGKDARDGKLTYVSHYGIDRARTKAREFTQNAIDALAGFGARAEFLQDVAARMLSRIK